MLTILSWSCQCLRKLHGNDLKRGECSYDNTTARMVLHHVCTQTTVNCHSHTCNRLLDRSKTLRSFNLLMQSGRAAMPLLASSSSCTHTNKSPIHCTGGHQHISLLQTFA